MLQQKPTSLRNEIAFLLAIAAAEFKLTNSKSVVTDDGAAWHATLTHGRNKIVTVSNGGFGGPNESHFHAATPTARDADKASLATLFAIPEVAAVIRGHMLSEWALEQDDSDVTGSDYLAARARVEDQVPELTENNVEFLVSRIADAGGTIALFKRAIKTKLLVVFEGGDEVREYSTYKLTDTPANREKVKAHSKGRKIDFFIADLFGTTNESKGA